MKKTRINLLSSRDENIRVARTLQILRYTVVVYCCLFVLSTVVFIVIQFQQNQRIQELINQKTTLLSDLSNYRDEEAKLVFVAKKVKSYNQFILDDARFLPYYNLLVRALNTSGETTGGISSAILSSFTLDKERVVTFTLLFGTVVEMVDSFRFIESQEFLSNFEELSLNGLTIGTNQEENSLIFSGKFKQLGDETTN